MTLDIRWKVSSLTQSPIVLQWRTRRPLKTQGTPSEPLAVLIGPPGKPYGNIDGGSAATVFIDSMQIDCGGA